MPRRLNESDLCVSRAGTRDARDAVPLRREEVRRRRRAERAEFANEVRLIGVAVVVRQLRPAARWSHGRVLPRSRETGEPLKPLRRRPDDGEEPSMQMARRDTELARELDDRHGLFRGEQPIDGADDQAVRECRAALAGLEQY